MSTYNGEKYIQEQIDSIFRQNNVDVTLIIRDDGSTDHTLDIIKMQKYNIVLLEGKNIGAENSFMELLYSEYEADYYAFSDQDDVWMPDKLCTAIENLSKTNSAGLYACNLYWTDENLNICGKVFSDQDIKHFACKMERDYLCNLHGCVLVWNNSLQKMLKAYRPQGQIPHDLWVNSVANAVRCFVSLDLVPHIYYRQHSNNFSGIERKQWKRIWKGIKLYLCNPRYRMSQVASEILSGYGKYMDKKANGYTILRLTGNYPQNICTKVKLIRTHLLSDRPFMEYIFMCISVLLNRY